MKFRILFIILGILVTGCNGENISFNSALQVKRTVNVIALVPPITPKEDKTLPVITLIGTDVKITEGETYIDAGATANDDIDGNITKNILISNPVDNNIVGTYTITYDVNDSSNNSALQVKRTVNVIAVSNWRTEYLEDAKETLFTKYTSEYNETLPPMTYEWIVSHGFENSLLQATEINPRVIKNVEEILLGLNDTVSEEYANMIFAISMARSTYGVGSIEFSNNRFSRIPTPLKESEIKNNKLIEKYSKMTEDFIIDNGWDLNQSIDNMNNILEHLKANGDNKKLTKSVVNVAEYIHMINKRNNLVKPRSPNASAVEYINHLAIIQKKSIAPFTFKGENLVSANIFPHTAPWPLLMPLAEMRPVDEMEWVWNRFKDESLEKKYRYRLYGYYRKPPEVIAPYIARATHSKGSVEYINNVGGVCGTMSQIGRATFISLGVPSMGTGQPKHACIMRYNVTADNKYMTSFEQSISTLYNSTPDWFFLEDDSFRIASHNVSYGEYQMGLGLAMNSPLQDYLDSRTLVRLAANAEGDEKKELLKKATDASIYNAEAVYDRFEAMGRDFISTKILITELMEKLPSSADGYTTSKAPDEDLTNEDKNVSLDSSIVQYRDTVISVLITQLFKESYMNQTPLSNEYKSWIKVVNAQNYYDLMQYYSLEAFDHRNQDLKEGKYVKVLAADIERNRELKRQEKNAANKKLIIEKEQLIIDKESELADENTTNKRKKALEKQIDRLHNQIATLNNEISDNNALTLLYLEYINGDGLSMMLPN
ncbi:MAG TPA: DUF5011 domain-containing protein [Campylobacterales bacterium]|nr:DUF5011 domain-containing protein [Campylobacterales bacterium]